MGNSESYIPKYNPEDYVKTRPGKNVYKKYKKNVYWHGQKVQQANGLSFVDLGNGYGRDSTFIFYKGRIIITEPRKSFTVLSDGYAKDRYNVYLNGNIISDNPSKFRVKLKN